MPKVKKHSQPLQYKILYINLCTKITAVALQKKRKKVADRMQKDRHVYICTNCIFMRE